ncbi:MAG TPA: class I SAM-dependent methyltransferase [Marmoricola sp.]|nr:class I SAM-dependent methyltransferase [Marmoricola sp.]
MLVGQAWMQAGGLVLILHRTEGTGVAGILRATQVSFLIVPTATPRPIWAPTLRRSVRLFNDFRYEQPDPARFYTALANDAVGQLSGYLNLDQVQLLDVGGGPGYFRDAFTGAGATYYSLDADVGELSGLGEIGPGTVIGSGLELPFRDDSFDLVYSSNVLEHVPDPWRMADEMVRVTKPGGVTYLSYTLWYGPWGGHETAPWHYFGGSFARRRYAARHGHEPKNKWGESLFRVTATAGLNWARNQTRAEVLDLIPRYNPSWSYGLLRVPGVREVLTWNLVIVLKKH